MLTYRIFDTKVKIETASSLASYAKDFENELAAWKRLCKSPEAPEILVYVLDNYIDEDVRFSALQNEDKHKARYLRERCAKEGVYPYLSKMKCVFDEYNESGGDSLELEGIVDFDDNVILEGCAVIDHENLIQDDVFKYRESDDPEYPEDPWEENYVHHYVDLVRSFSVHICARS